MPYRRNPIVPFIQGTTDPLILERNCIFCGERGVTASLCYKCSSVFLRDIQSQWAKKKINPHVACRKCGYHAKACKCEHKQKLDRLTGTVPKESSNSDDAWVDLAMTDFR